MMKTKTIILAAISLAWISVAQASVISGSASAVSGFMTNNMTALGSVDWAYWNTSVSSGASAPANQKSGGTAISDASPFGTASLRGTSGSGTETTFSYTDGTSPVSGTLSGPGGYGPSGIFYTGLGSSSIGNGVQLSVTLPTTDVYTIHLWTAAYHATGELTVSLPGATSYVDSSTTDALGHNPLPTYDYTLTAQADAPGDIVNILLKTTATDGNSAAHTLISGIAVIPEPATMGLLVIGATVLIGARRMRM